ncbi:hypothetical protein [Escherichia phage e4/1c]|uniref:Uncharacterized protein n=1 Tax=Escherichia phage e4/1c TaxID=1495286 RepID=A0A023ZU99_9CAUD|nr:hypothetical protein e41c_0062 [Escherichia phage e4/1c]AHY83212.1 hypothetical protein [Escherichia phage e4/1c]
MEQVKIKLTNVDYKYDEDSTSLREMGYEEGEIAVAFKMITGTYQIQSKKDVVFDDIIAIYKHELCEISDEEFEVLV